VNASGVLGAAVPVLSALLLGGVLLTVLARAWRLHAERRRQADHDLVRGRLLQLLAQGRPGRVRSASSRRQQDAVLEVTATLLRKIRGEDRALLVAVLERDGLVEAARARSYRRGAVGRARAASLVGNAGATRALPELARLLRDRDPQVRSAAARGLGRLGEPGAAPFLLAALEEPRPLPAGLVAGALLDLGPATTPALVEGLRHGTAAARAVAAELLGLHGALPAAGQLAEVLRDDAEPAVRTAAARALGRLGSPAAVPGLLAALTGDAAGTVRAAAAAALGAVGDPRAVEALDAALDEPDLSVGRAAARALTRCGPGGAEAARRRAGAGGTAGEHAAEALERAA
jgi:HEAT repeat protein